MTYDFILQYVCQLYLKNSTYNFKARNNFIQIKCAKLELFSPIFITLTRNIHRKFWQEILTYKFFWQHVCQLCLKNSTFDFKARNNFIQMKCAKLELFSPIFIMLTGKIDRKFWKTSFIFFMDIPLKKNTEVRPIGPYFIEVHVWHTDYVIWWTPWHCTHNLVALPKYYRKLACLYKLTLQISLAKIWLENLDMGKWL